jgi:membrane-bound serine protease (ClpP class)
VERAGPLPIRERPHVRSRAVSNPRVFPNACRRFLRIALALCGLLLAGSWLAGRPAGAATASGPSVDVVKVGGVLDPAESAYVRGSIEAAAAAGSTVILQIDSLGSFGRRAEDLAAFIRSTSVPVVAWVGPTGARAQSGALSLVYSSGLIAMAPGAGLGPGRPFDLSTRASKEDPAEATAHAAAIERLAAGSGATRSGVEAAIRTALPAGPALRSHAVSLVAPDIPTLLRALNGRTVRTGTGGMVRLVTLSSPGRQAAIRFHEIGPVRRTLHAVSTPVAVYVLLVIGLWGVLFEFTQPGIGLAGIVGVLSLALAGYGLWVVPFRWWGLLLLVAGIGFQAWDVVIRRLAWFTGLGTALFFAGSVGTWWQVAPAVRVPLWLPILFTLAGVLLFGFGFTVAIQARERIRSQQVGLVGLTGEVRSDLDPEGGVVVKGAVWRARSMNGPIAKGTKVRVRGIDGLVLTVEPEPNPGRGAGGGPVGSDPPPIADT